MIAAAVIDVDMSGQKFGMNLLSSDGIIYDGSGLNVKDIKNHDTLYIVYHSHEYSHAEIARVRKQTPGLNGWFTYYLAKTWHVTRINPKYYYHLFRLINSSLLALVIILIIRELKKAYNILFACVFYCVCLMSTWIANFAPNLYWSEFTWFIPMLGGLMCLNNPDKKFRACLVVFLGTALKSACGYEYITTIMLCSVVFLITEYLSGKKFLFKSICCVAIASLAGFFTVLMIHAYMRGETGIIDGLSKIYHADVLRRTFGPAAMFDKVYTPSLNASVWDVLIKYLFNRGAQTSILASFMIILAPCSMLFANISLSRPVKHDFIMFAASFIASISWFVLGKSHSYVHTHMNYVLWYMPFIPAAFYIFIKNYLISGVIDYENL